jgi:hypothetical protein
MVGLIFLVLGTGNVLTTSTIIPAKIRESKMGLIKLRFTRLDKYFWSHKRRRADSLCEPNKKVHIQPAVEIEQGGQSPFFGRACLLFFCHLGPQNKSLYSRKQLQHFYYPNILSSNKSGRS